ncbi:MAG: iron-containing alcohol dehydrogenase [Desulfovibrio sp.]|jgi:3-deoxy-alpha-D-manno-octulosonate 8-oxidase|nr:iron-containing alcohol dehydrogenase [Desulfovibrio sp.]
MSTTRNTKNVPYYMLGFGAFSHLGELLEPKRAEGGPVFFYVDHYFQDKELAGKLPAAPGDKVFFVDTGSEPTVEFVDDLADAAKAMLNGGLPCCLVGIGGGATLDTAKAVGNLLTNPGKAEAYQGWELVKNPAVYKIGVPTLAGTGAEVSRTCVLTNMRRKLKLGMNSDYTVYDQLLLDPSLTRTVPRDQFFFTGMDTFMHCFESYRGGYRNIIVDTLSQTAITMCREIFLASGDMMREENLEKMTVASYIGGMAAGNVGVVHPLSAGLSIVLHLPHGKANCYALSVLKDIYPEEYDQFTEMMARQKVVLPRGICADLTDEQYDALYQGTIIHEKPLNNALGPDFRQILTKKRLIAMFKSM